ncbi:MAG: glycoside hydrolase family 66 protein [Mycobacterium leprae]
MPWAITVWPDRGQYRPGAAVGLVASVEGAPGSAVTVRVEIRERAAVVANLIAPVTLDATGHRRITLSWQPPTGGAAWRAFGADASLVQAGNAVATAATAFDVAPTWGYAPRYGFLSDFRPGGSAEQDAETLDHLLRLHISCVQFYDWMYTHYDYLPPTTVFTDVLGRTVDFDAVRRRVQFCRARGMAPIAYGSVYGAEKPFSDAHPDWLLYDGAGNPYNLANLFFIQDPSPESGWRQYLLGAYKQALDLGFAGIHCDTYGSPKAGLTHDGRLVRLDEVLPGLMADAQALAEAADPVEGGCMLNNVKAWPLESMAKAPGSTLYSEVWPPEVTYHDLHELILRHRRLDTRRQPILAAYLEPFYPKHERPEGAMAGLRLASATIFASGGFHLLPGEGQGILAHAYYPDHGRLSAEDWAVVQAYWDFQTRYGPLLADPSAVDVTVANCGNGAQESQYGGEGLAFSAKALPGTVWTILKDGPGYRTVNLLNLTAVTTPEWNAAQPDAPELKGIEVRLECLKAPRAVWWASPDVEGGKPQPLPYRLEPAPGAGQVLTCTLPTLRYWDLLVVEA